MMNEKQMYMVSEWALIVGGLHMGLAEFTDVSLLGYIPEVVMPFAYGLIGASALYLAYLKISIGK